MMIDKTEIEKLVLEYIGESEMFLVEVIVNPGNIIHVHVDKPAGISIGECAKMHRFIIGKLEEEEEDYELEVSSPGLGSALKVLPQYIKNIGQTLEVVQFNGMKEKGVLLNATSNSIEIEVSRKIKKEGKKRPEIVEEPLTIDMKDIKSSKVLISFK